MTDSMARILGLLTAVSMTAVSTPALAIIGGHRADPGAHPSLVSIQDAEGHFCSGVILNARTVLTAAHCVYHTPIARLRVVAGLHARSDLTGTQISNVASVHSHDWYSPDVGLFADIAIVVLVDALEFGDGVQRAAILAPAFPYQLDPNFYNSLYVHPYFDMDVQIAGWGLTSYSNMLPDFLHEAAMHTITQEEALARTADITHEMMWIDKLPIFDVSGRAGACIGDNGGPVYLPLPNSEGIEVVGGVIAWGISGGGIVCPSTRKLRRMSPFMRIGFRRTHRVGSPLIRCPLQVWIRSDPERGRDLVGVA